MLGGTYKRLRRRSPIFLVVIVKRRSPGGTGGLTFAAATSRLSFTTLPSHLGIMAWTNDTPEGRGQDQLCFPSFGLY